MKQMFQSEMNMIWCGAKAAQRDPRNEWNCVEPERIDMFQCPPRAVAEIPFPFALHNLYWAHIFFLFQTRLHIYGYRWLHVPHCGNEQRQTALPHTHTHKTTLPHNKISVAPVDKGFCFVNSNRDQMLIPKKRVGWRNTAIIISVLMSFVIHRLGVWMRGIHRVKPPSGTTVIHFAMAEAQWHYRTHSCESLDDNH